MPGETLPFVSKEKISASYVSVTKYIVNKYIAPMSYIPVTTELNLRLNNKPLHLPVDKDHGLLISTLKSAFGQSAIGLKFAENHRVKVVVCKNNKLFPPKVTPYVVFVVINENDNPQVDIPDSLARTRLSRTLNANKPNNTHNCTSSSSELFPEVSYQEIEDLDMSDFRVESDMLAKLCQ